MESLGNFEDRIRAAISAEVHETMARLDAREKIVAERERLVEKVFRQLPADQATPVRVLIGGREFHTTDAVLTSKDSLLCAIINNPDHKFKQRSGQDIILPGDGETFPYILEYLHYGRLFTPLTPAARAKLEVDAEFLCMPLEFMELLREGGGGGGGISGGSTGEQPNFLIKQSSTAPGSSGKWRFTNRDYVSPDTSVLEFSDDDNAIVVKQSGVYHIIVRACAASTGPGQFFELHVDGVAVARCFHGNANGLEHSSELSDIRYLVAGCSVSVCNSANIFAPLQGQPSDPLKNQLTICKLNQ